MLAAVGAVTGGGGGFGAASAGSPWPDAAVEQPVAAQQADARVARAARAAAGLQEGA